MRRTDLQRTQTDSPKPERVKWRVPGFPNWDALGIMLKKAKVSDITVIVNSIAPASPAPSADRAQCALAKRAAHEAALFVSGGVSPRLTF